MCRSLAIPARQLVGLPVFRTSLSRGFSSQQLLGLENRALTVEKMKAMRPLRPPPTGPHIKEAAVLVPLCVNSEDQVCLLFNKRTGHLRTHAYEVSFPGGKSEGDESIMDTALRETEEELKIKPRNIEVWGCLPPLGSKSGDMAVTPVVGRLSQEPFHVDRVDFHQGEVNEVFIMPVRTLATRSVARYTQFRVPRQSQGYSLPVYDSEPHRIWGLTAIITHQLLSILLPDYQHPLHYQRQMKTG